MDFAPKSIEVWINGIGVLERKEKEFVIQKLNAADVKAAQIPTLTPSDLKEIGIASFGVRKALATSIASLGLPGPTGGPPRPETIPKKEAELTMEMKKVIYKATGHELDPTDIRIINTTYKVLIPSILTMSLTDLLIFMKDVNYVKSCEAGNFGSSTKRLIFQTDEIIILGKFPNGHRHLMETGTYKGEPIFIKFCTPRYQSELDAEFSFLKAIQSPYVVKAFSVMNVPKRDGLVGLVTFDGGSSLQILYPKGGFQDLLRFGIQIGMGLQEFHIRGWCFNDVKPANIVYGKNYLLIDGGGVTTTGAPAQETTPGFVADEIPFLASPKNDIIGLAKTLFYLVTGKVYLRVYNGVKYDLGDITDKTAKHIIGSLVWGATCGLDLAWTLLQYSLENKVFFPKELQEFGKLFSQWLNHILITLPITVTEVVTEYFMPHLD